uniref:uncharacterized protein LOC124002790 n=1 Tax=Oncorhynchus gorbuscha TaxID=8017 RepID=UPI001EAF7725|nr:uncharacterized protein LOC124002790 [Oncorhynchus gorbuscha]
MAIIIFQCSLIIYLLCFTCLLGLNSGPANWPGTSRLGGGHLQSALPNPSQRHAVFRRQEEQVGAHSGRRRGHQGGSTDLPRLMAQINLQLFELNQRTISQWYSRGQRKRMVLQQGLGLAAAPSFTAQGHRQAPPLSPSTTSRRAHARPPSKESPSILPAHLEQQPPAHLGPSQPPPVPRTTAWRKKRMAEDTEEDTAGKRRQREQCVCAKSGLLETGHSRFGSEAFCSVAAGGKNVAQWLVEMKDTKGRGEEH